MADQTEHREPPDQSTPRDARPGVGGFGPGAAGQAGRAGSSERPHVRCEPGMRWGYPTVRGVATDAVAGMVWAGESVEVVADDYGLDRDGPGTGRGWVLVACWFEAVHGKPRTGYRRAWKAWAEQAGDAVCRGADWAAVPDPPDREEANGRG